MDMPDPQPASGPSSSNLSSVSESGSGQESSSLETEPGSNPPVEEKPDTGQTELKPSHVPGNTGSFSSFYSLQRMLGQGCSGTVYEAVRKSDGQMVAVKFLRKLYLDKVHVLPEYSRPLHLEVAVILMLQKPPASPYIVQMLDWFEEPERHVMIMEFPHPCKTLRDFIKDKDSLDETVARGLFRQAVLAVKHCIGRGVVHNDIKSDNVLVNTEAMQLKLIDFDCSYFCKENAEEHASSEIGTLGCLLFEMVTGIEYIDKFSVPSQEQFDSFYNGPASEECCDLVRRCTAPHRFERPTLDEILEDKWLKQG